MELDDNYYHLAICRKSQATVVSIPYYKYDSITIIYACITIIIMKSVLYNLVFMFAMMLALLSLSSCSDSRSNAWVALNDGKVVGHAYGMYDDESYMMEGESLPDTVKCIRKDVVLWFNHIEIENVRNDAKLLFIREPVFRGSYNQRIRLREKWLESL